MVYKFNILFIYFIVSIIQHCQFARPRVLFIFIYEHLVIIYILCVCVCVCVCVSLSVCQSMWYVFLENENKNVRAELIWRFLIATINTSIHISLKEV